MRMIILSRFDELMNMFLQSRKNPPHPRVPIRALWIVDVQPCYLSEHLACQRVDVVAEHLCLATLSAEHFCKALL